MNSKLYRCGWCGFPTKETGECLTGEQFEKADKIIAEYGDGHTVLVHGWCCEEEQQKEANRMQVTRDMALDAQDPSLEGTWI